MHRHFWWNDPLWPGDNWHRDDQRRLDWHYSGTDFIINRNEVTINFMWVPNVAGDNDDINNNVIIPATAILTANNAVDFSMRSDRSYMTPPWLHIFGMHPRPIPNSSLTPETNPIFFNRTMNIVQWKIRFRNWSSDINKGDLVINSMLDSIYNSANALITSHKNNKQPIIRFAIQVDGETFVNVDNPGNNIGL